MTTDYDKDLTVPDLPAAFLDSLGDNVAILNTNGVIVATNEAWQEFAHRNGFEGDSEMLGVDYFRPAKKTFDRNTEHAFSGIRNVLNGTDPEFTTEYPCHSPDRQRWFELQASRFTLNETIYITITHSDITERKRREIKIKEQAEFLDTINDRMPGIAYQFKASPNGEYSFAYLSDGYEELTGVPAEAAIEDFENAISTLHPEDVEPTLASIEEAVDNKNTWKQEARFQLPGGDQKWLMASGRPEKQDDGSLVFSGVIFDITERKELEEELRESEELHRATLNNITDTVFITDDDGHFTYVCPNINYIFGHSAEQVRELGSVQELLGEDPAPESLDENGTAENIERIITDDDEVKHNVLVSVKSVSIQGGTRLYTLRDVTKIAEYREKLARKNRRQELAQKLANLGHWSVTIPKQEILWSDETYRIFGLDPSENDLSLEEGLEYYHPDDRERTRRLLEESVQNCEEVNFEARVKRPDGEIRHIDVYGIPQTNEDGSVTELFGVVQDITEQKQREDELERNRDLLYETEQLANTGGWEADAETGEQRWTQGTYHIHDLDPDETDPTVVNGIEYYHPEDQPEIKQSIQKCMEKGKPYDVELRLITAEDRLRWVNATGQPVYENGQIVAVRGAIQDITERKKREQELTLKNRAIEEAPVGITIADASREDNPLTYVNNAFTELTGYTEDDAIGDNCRFLQGEETRDTPVDNLREAISAGEPITEELINYRKDGEKFWNQVTVSPIRNDDNTISHYLGFQRDITERKDKERSLRRFRRAVEATGHAVFLTDPDGRIEYVNPAFETVTGYNRNEIIGKQPEVLQSGEMSDDYYEELWTTIQSGQTWRGEMTDRRKNGELYSARQTIAPIKNDEDEIEAFIAIQTDITELKQTKEELERSQERFDQLAENISEIFWMFNEDFSQLLYINDAQYEQIWGRNPETLHEDPQDFLKGIHPEDHDKATRAMSALMDGNKQKLDLRVNSTEDFERWIQVEGVPLLDDAGNVTKITGTITDITERKTTEEALRESEERFRQLTENIDEVFWMTNLDKTETIYISPKYESVWGRSVNSLYENPESFIDAIHPEDRQRVKDALPEQKEGPYEIEYRIHQPDGELRWIRDRAFPVEDESGEIYRIAGVAEDITEMKNLQQEREKFVELVEHSSNFIARTNLNGELLYVNQAGLDMIGVDDLDGIKGDHINSLYLDESLSDQRDPVSRIRVEGEWNGKQEFVDRETGEAIDVLFNGFVINHPDTGDPLEYAVVATDITEQTEIEQQLRKMVKEKETLLQEVHHRVKNNLQVVLGLLGLQARELDDDVARQALENSKGRVQSMAMIHEKLYEGSHLSTLDFEDYVTDLIDKIVESYGTGNDNLEIQTSISPSNLDPDTIINCGLILNELISNALEHGLNNVDNPRISVEFHTDERMNHHLKISDNGIGFDPEEVDRAKSLGLTLVHNLSENQLHGEINFSSEDGLKAELIFPPEKGRYDETSGN